MQSKLSRDEKLKKAIELYEAKYGTGSFGKSLLARIKIATTFDEELKSKAKARYRGAHRGVALTSVRADGPEAVKEALEESWRLVEEKAEHGRKARESAVEYKAAAKAYRESMDPLIEAFAEASDFGIDGVDAYAAEIVGILREAQANVVEYEKALDLVVEKVGQLDSTIELLRKEPPRSVVEAKGIPVLADGALKDVRNAEDELAKEVRRINDYGVQASKRLETLVKEICARVISWRKSQKTFEKMDKAAKMLQKGIDSAKVVAGEPIAHSALHGVRVLIHAATDGIKLIYTEVKTRELIGKDLDLLDELEADDLLQWKFDMILMGLEWLTEPLGLIPHLGSVIQNACNSASKVVIGILKAAATKQAKEFKGVQEEAKDSILKTFSKEVESGVKSLGKKAVKEVGKSVSQIPDLDVSSLVDDIETDVSAMAVKLVMKVLEGPITTLLAEVIPSMKMLDKEKIKGTLTTGRESAVKMSESAREFDDIEADFTFDEAVAREATKAALRNLKPKDEIDFVCAVAPELEQSRGIALLVGDGHTDDNVAFVDVLLRAGHGWTGKVVGGTGTIWKDVHFSVPAPEAKDLVTEYWEQVLKGVSGKALKFTPPPGK